MGLGVKASPGQIICQTCSVWDDYRDKTLLYVCCNCGFGPYNVTLYPSCFTCGHYFELHPPTVSYLGCDNDINPGGRSVNKENKTSREKVTSRKQQPPIEFPSQSPALCRVTDAPDSIERDSASHISKPDENDDCYFKFESNDTSSTCLTGPELIDWEYMIPQIVLSSIQGWAEDVMRSAYFSSLSKDFLANVVYHATDGETSNNVSTNATGAVSSTDAATHITSAKRGTHANDAPPPDDGADDDDDSDDERDRPKRQRLSGPARKSGRKLACPYFRRDPEAFGNGKLCSRSGWPSIHRLKEHLYRGHKLHQCNRCYGTFRSEIHLKEHWAELQDCEGNEPQPSDPRDGFTEAQEQELKRKKGYSTMSEVDKWNSLYMILFPDADSNRLPPAYRDEREGADARPKEAAHSREFPSFETLLQDFSCRVRKKLEELLQKDSKLLEKINSQLPDILQSSYNELISSHSFEGPFLIPETGKQSNKGRRFGAEEHGEMSSEQTTAEPWHSWINFDNCVPPVNDTGSDYSQNKQSVVNLVDNYAETSLRPFVDPRDLLPCLRQEFEFEDVPSDNTQSALSLLERDENGNDKYQLNNSESGLESVKIPPAYDLMMGDSTLSNAAFLFSQCGDGQALPNVVTEQPLSRRRPEDQHITEPRKTRLEAMVSGSCPSKELEEEFGAQSTWK